MEQCHITLTSVTTQSLESWGNGPPEHFLPICLSGNNTTNQDSGDLLFVDLSSGFNTIIRNLIGWEQCPPGMCGSPTTLLPTQMACHSPSVKLWRFSDDATVGFIRNRRVCSQTGGRASGCRAPHRIIGAPLPPPGSVLHQDRKNPVRPLPPSRKALPPTFV